MREKMRDIVRAALQQPQYVFANDSGVFSVHSIIPNLIKIQNARAALCSALRLNEF